MAGLPIRSHASRYRVLLHIPQSRGTFSHKATVLPHILLTILLVPLERLPPRLTLNHPV